MRAEPHLEQGQTTGTGGGAAAWPLVWTGRGASLALAHALAGALRRCGHAAFAAAPCDLVGTELRGVGVVSRSGAMPDLTVRAAVVGEGAGFDRPGALVVRVPDAATPRDAWLPLEFLDDAVLAFAAALGLQPPRSPACLDAVAVSPNRIEVVVVERDALGLRALFEAASAKLGPLPLVALDAGEFGHGLHSRVVLEPTRYRVRFVPEGAESPEMERIRSWCRARGVPHLTAGAVCTSNPAAFPLAAFRLAIRLVQRWCEAREVDWSVAPIARVDDELRTASAQIP